MLTSGISFTNFKSKVSASKIRQKLTSIIKDKSQVIESLGKNYKNSYSKKQLKKYTKSLNFRVIGMGGSTLGTQAIYDFLRSKIKKNFLFIDNLEVNNNNSESKKKIFTNLIFSKSGKTIETIVN